MSLLGWLSRSPTYWMAQIAGVYSLTVPEPQSLESRCWQSCFFFGHSVWSLSQALSSFWCIQQSRHSLACSCITPIFSLSSHDLLLCVSVSQFPSSYKDTNHWIRTKPTPVQPHLKLTVSAQTLFQKKGILTGSSGHEFWGLYSPSTGMLSWCKEWGPCLSFGGELHRLCLALVETVTEIEVASGQVCAHTHAATSPD